jgi:DeoR/GlpR family transcriptional regulator of sugar metabolism
MINLSSIERQERIIHLLRQQERLSLNDVCELFSISIATARRDFEALADAGKARRVHGGIIPLYHSPPESPILQRQLEQQEEKRRIGRLAAQLVKSGETIVLTGGSTTLEAAYQLKDHDDLTVITNSLPIANVLADTPRIALIVLGGVFRHSEKSLIGHITEQAIADLRADKVIMGIRAIDMEQGLTNDHVPETTTDRALIRAAREVIVVADHTKFGLVSTAFVAPLNVVNMLITDTLTPTAYVSALQAMNISVLQA